MKLHSLLLCAASILTAHTSSAAQSKPGSHPVVVGLDLGNHNSVVAVAGRTGVDVLVNGVSGRQFPSAVYFGGESRLIGEHTEGTGAANPPNLITQFKRLLFGSKQDEHTLAPLPYSTEPDAEHPGTLRAAVTHKGSELQLPAASLLAMTMRHAADLAEGQHSSSGAGTSTICIGVPSYYSAAQRRAVADAALIAGLPHPVLMDEGTAAALGYGLCKGGLPAKGQEPRVVVFVDVGHAATQVTVASFTEAGMKVLGRLVTLLSHFSLHLCGDAAAPAFIARTTTHRKQRK
jgi:molecular chaperone DnaK (HSP70)